MEEELKTLLYHLGQDVSYMGLRVQQDVQKCLRELQATSDSKKFCNKLAKILKTFSEYTIQYSIDLQKRIKDYKKEEEYSDITKKLREISSAQKVNFYTCKNECKKEENGPETSNSLGPPNNNDEQSSELSKYELKNDVLSQSSSLHIGGEDEIKSEPSAQTQSPVVQDEDVPANDLTNIQESLSTEHQQNNSSYITTNPSHVDNAIADDQVDDIFEEVENCSLEALDNDSDVANSLEISHSEEVEDEADVIICTSDEGDIPDIPIVDSTLKNQSKDEDFNTNKMENSVLNLENAPRRSDAIPLPWKEGFEKTNQDLEADSNAKRISVSGDGERIAKSHEANEPQKSDAIPLPYKPLLEKENTIHETATVEADAAAEPVPLPNNEAKSDLAMEEDSAHADQDGDCDIEIVSVASSPEDDDSDVEIIEDIPSSDVGNSANTADSQNADAVNSNAKNDSSQVVRRSLALLKNDFKEESVLDSATMTETQDTNDRLDSEPETVKNNSPPAKAILSRRNSSEETVANEAKTTELQNSDRSSVNSDGETAKNDSGGSTEDSEKDVAKSLPKNICENNKEQDEWNNETVADNAALDRRENFVQDTVHNVNGADTVTNVSPHQPNSPTVDSDQDTVHNSPQANIDNTGSSASDETVSTESPLAVPLQNNAEEGSYSEETIGDHSGSGENDSEDTIIASPVDGVGAAAAAKESSPKMKLRKQQSDSDDDIYSKPTQKIKIYTQKSNVANDKANSDDDFGAATQRISVTDDGDESNVSKSVVDTKEQDASTIDKNDANAKANSDGDFDAATQRMSGDGDESNVPKSVVDGQEQDASTIDKNDDFLRLTGEKSGDSAGKSSDESEEADEAATQDIEIPQNHAVTAIRNDFMENSENDTTSSQNSFVFNLDDGQSLRVSSPANASDGPMLTVEDLVAPSNDKTKSISDCEGVKADDMSISEFESGSSSSDSSIVGDSSDSDNKSKGIASKPKRKLKDKTRKSLLKVIAEYFSKRKRDKAESTKKNLNDSKDESRKVTLKKNDKKEDKKSPGKSNATGETTKRKPESRVKTKREKKKSSNKGEKDAKEYLDFLHASRIDGTSNSSADFSKDNVNIQEDSSDSTDNDATQIENFKSTDIHTDENKIDPNPDKAEQQGKGNEQIEIVAETNKSDSENSEDSEELFQVSERATKDKSEAPEDTTQSLSDTVDQLPLKPTECQSNTSKDAKEPDDGFEDPDLTQKVDDLRKLRQLSKENVCSDNVFDQPTQKIDASTSEEPSKDHENQLIQGGRSKPEENDDSQVVSPFKRKVVRPLPSTLSDGEDACNKPSESPDSEETNEDSQVVSPFKKKGVKRLHSSDESDSEPPKKTSEPQDSQESDIFGSATQEVVRPLKRSSVKKLPSTDDDQSESTHKGSDNYESESEPATKRRKVPKLLSSEHSDSDDLDKDQNKQLDKDQSDREDQDMSEENDHHIDPSQFKLDDKARDDFLEMFDQPNKDTSSSDKDSVREEIGDEDRDDTSDNEEANVEASQFRLADCDRDNLLNLLTDKINDELEREVSNELLDLLNSKEISDSKDDDKSDQTVDTEVVSDSSDRSAKNEEKIQPSQFKLNSADRDELLELLTSEQSDESRVAIEADSNKEDSSSDIKDTLKTKNKSVKNEGNNDDEEIDPSQFKLNNKARDDFLDMLSNGQRDNSEDKNISEDKELNDNNDATEEETGSKENDNKNEENRDGPMDVDKVGDDGVNNRDDGVADRDDVDDTITENSQGIDDVDESDADANAPNNEDTLVGEENDQDKDDEKTVSDPSEFNLDEKERDELLNLLSEHIKQKEKISRSADSESETSDAENRKGKHKRKRRKSKKVDEDMLLELLQEYEKVIKEKELNESIKNGDMEFDDMDGDNEFAKRDEGEDSGADSESVLLDLLREETVDQPEEGRKKRTRDTNKAAWNAYQKLLGDKEDLSDTSSEISDIDIDDLELDFSDQERKKKERIVNAQLRVKFNIKKELIVNVEQTDISGFDWSSLPQRGGKYSSTIDRLCDISNVLQKRKKPERKRRKAKLQRLSPSVRSSSISDSSILDSDESLLSSDDSTQANQGSASDRASPFHLSDDNAEQEKLANALWENIKNSSDENSVCSSDSESSDDDEDEKKKKKSGGGGGRVKKKKEMKKESDDSQEEDGSGEETGSEKSGESENSDGDENGEGEKNVKEADLDSSDEEDFVGVRKSRGAWRHDPLLKGCLSSDEDSDFESDAKKERNGNKIRKRLMKKEATGDSERLGMKTPTEEIDDSSDSDVEFVMEKKKTPKKMIVIDDDDDDEDDTEESPSKRGQGRRNIRALVEDDELAEATKQAKKEESERIKRLQQREKAKESFTQTQSFGSQMTQMSEEDADPLILDVNEELQIKVHPKISKKLKPHQRDGIQFMWDSCYESVEQLRKGYEGSGCILAHCMGLGKTLQALGLIHTLFNYREDTKTKHVLVVCPLSTVSNWRNEYRLAYRDIRRCNVQLYTIHDKKSGGHRFEIVERWWKSGGLLIMGYECFGLMSNDQKLDKCAQKNICKKEEILKALVDPGPDLVICDEGHLLRNKQTQRNLALNKVKTKRRIVLTGTPLQNNLQEYYYMVHFVKPNLLGTEKEFKTNFVNPISNGQFENSTATDILFMKKRTHVLHKILGKTVQRVEDTELKQYLPQLVDQALFVRLSDLQVKFYNTYLDGANARPVEYTSAGNISRKNFLADIQILRYICSHPDIVTIAKKSVKSKIKEQDVIDDNMDEAIEAKVFSQGHWFKELLPESGVKRPELGTKLMMALGIVKEAAVNNDKVLIFSQTHAEMDSLEFFLDQELKYKKGVDYNRMDGTISPEVRTHMCDKFNNKHNKRLRVFIMSTKVGGLGLNLTAANRVILMSVNWNPSYDIQSVFRAFRFGQDKPVYVYRLIAIDTMEEKMYQRQVTKLAVAHRVVDKHQITRHYSAADIQEFYSARPTIEGERPLPNVPEDRVLAKLIQKHPFLYKWHEHQALLANRPEEDLNEQQKNAAWEEFNKKAVEPPVPGMPPPPVPQFVNVSNLLNQPGPSGIQNRVVPPNYPPINLQTGRRRTRKSTRMNPIPNPLRAMSNYVVPRTMPVLIKQTPSGPKLVIQTHGRIRGKEFHLNLDFAQPVQNAVRRPAHTVTSGVDGNAGAPDDVSRDDEAARKIQEINSLVSGQTTSELIPGFNTAMTTDTFNSSVVNEHQDDHASRIEEINSIISASLGQDEAVSSQNLELSSPDWDNDGMNATLASVNLPQDGSEDSTGGHFADHNYSLPKTIPLNFRTSSGHDFRPMPPPRFQNIPRPLFVDVGAPLDSPIRIFSRKKKYKIYKRPIVTQRTSSADDFRTTQPKYMPRPLFVDVQAPLGPRPNLSGSSPPPKEKLRPSSATNKPVPVNQPTTTTNATTQVRLGSGITLTTQISNPKANPPPAHAQKPSVSIIPQAASTKTTSNAIAAKPPPYAPKSSSMVQNPLNLVKAAHNSNQKQTTKGGVWIQKEKIQNQSRNVIVNGATSSKQTSNSPQTSKGPQKITTAPPKRVVVPSPRAPAPPPLVQFPSKVVTLPPTIRPVPTASLLPPTSDPLSVTTSTTTKTSSATTPTQQSPLQKQMRNFMEHLHQLQQSMKEREGGVSTTVGSTAAGNNQGTLITTRVHNPGIPFTVNSSSRTVPNLSNSLPARTVVRVGPKPLSPVIGGISSTNITKLNAARNLSNITKTYQAVHSKGKGVMPPSTTPSTSQSSAHTVRVVGTLPTTISGSNTVSSTSRVAVPEAHSPRVVRRVITNSPKGAPRNTVINTVGQTNGAPQNTVAPTNGASRNTVITPIGQTNGASKSTVINPIGHTNNGNVARVITKVVGPKSTGAKTKINPVRLLNGKANGVNASTTAVGGIRIVPISPGTKKIVISQKEDGRQNTAPVHNQAFPVRLDLLQKKMNSNLNRALPKNLPPTPQSSFHNGTNLKTYQTKKNNPPLKSSSLPSLSLSQTAISVSKSNKENRGKRKLSLRTNNNTSSPNLMSSIDLSNDEGSGNNSSGSLSQDMVNTLKKKGVSINYLKNSKEKDVINLD